MSNEIQILHVDDDPSITDLTGTFLEREDDRFAVETATSADEGVQLIDDRPPDCVVSDYNMPGMDGIEFLQAVREEYPDLPFILFTGKGSEAVAGDAISAGVTDYLQKASDTEQYQLLANRIENAVRSRREAERADRQEQLMQLTGVTGDTGGFELDTETGELLLTDGVRRLINLPSQADLTLNEAIDLYHPEDREDIRQTIDRTRQTGEQTQGTWRLQAQDGNERIVDVTFTPATDDDIEILRGAIHDVTDRHERQQELKRERRFMTQALDALDDLFYVIDTDGTLRRWNEKSLEATGYSESELDDMPATELFTEDERKKVARAVETTLTTGEETLKADLLAADGQRVPYEFRGAHLTDENGNTTGLVGIGRDLTERRQRDRRFRALVEESNDIISVVDADGRYQYQSPSLERILGYDPEETVGDEVWEYIHPDDRETVIDEFETWIASPDKREVIEYRARDADGSWHWMESEGNDQFDNPAVEGYVVNSRDITERKERKREFEDQNERLDEFASIVSHDLRSPLTVAEGHLELAAETCESDHLARATDAIDRSQALIDDLLALAREGDRVDETEPVEIAKVAESSWQTVETRQATLDADESGVIEADRSRLQQLFENLYRNAVEHGGDDVTVSIGVMDDGFYFADSGPGIPESDREDVFEAGYSTNEDGTGFGLRIVKQIADAHGWEITVTESKGGGARFEITGVEKGA